MDMGKERSVLAGGVPTTRRRVAEDQDEWLRT